MASREAGFAGRFAAIDVYDGKAFFSEVIINDSPPKEVYYYVYILMMGQSEPYTKE